MIDYREAYAAWLRTRAESFVGKSKEEIEDMVSQLYDGWLDTPQEAFMGKCPRRYFDDFSSDALIDALLAYAKQDGPIPDPLCDAITDDEACVPMLLDVLDEPLTARQNQAVLERLSERQEEGMIDACMRMALGRDEEKADQAVQALMVFGQPVAKRALSHLRQNGISNGAMDRLADLVTSCGPCEGAVERLCALFEKRGDARAFYAQCLARLGDQRALPLLIQVARRPDLSYYDYSAIRNAVESLGGQLVDTREFSGDPDYMILKDLDD